MDDDLNTPEAFPAIFEMMTEVYKLIEKGEFSKQDAEEVLTQMQEFDKVLGVLQFEDETEDIAGKIEEMIQKREEAKKKKDYKTADHIRDELKKKGIILEDGKAGVKWKKA
jgi:cysteinyl-tRNA synthetase